MESNLFEDLEKDCNFLIKAAKEGHKRIMEAIPNVRGPFNVEIHDLELTFNFAISPAKFCENIDWEGPLSDNFEVRLYQITDYAAYWVSIIRNGCRVEKHTDLENLAKTVKFLYEKDFRECLTINSAE